MTLSTSAYKKLKKIVGNGNISRKDEDLTCYAYDATAKVYYPDAVLFPGNSGEVAAVLRFANEENVYVVPRGAGSGMTGGSLPVNGGIILVMTRLNRILDIDRDNLTAWVEPGVVTGRFHAAVEKEGLFYPPDPASSGFSTLGGNLAECSGGPRAVKYGVTRDYVLGLEVVLPTGEIIQTGVQTTKGVVGYDLTRLITGSEGTLGIITRITFRLLPLPLTVRTMTAVFNKIETAAETVSEIIRQGLIPRTIEFMDKASIECVKEHMNIGPSADVDALLLIEVDGKKDIAAREIKELHNLCLSRGAIEVTLAEAKEEAESLWKARKAISPALFRYGPDKINEDIVVPRSKIPHMVRKIEKLRNSTGLAMASFGHAGDGNIHFNIMLDKKNRNELEMAEAAVEEVFDYTIELGGTLSGEHGIGITKAPYLYKELGPVEIALMKKLKNLFDPKGILNPGKIFSSLR